MENASKALLIAGAVLVVIIIIGIGMMILNATTGTVKEAVGQVNSQEAQLFNAKFKKYEGRITGTNLRDLIKDVNANNGVNSSDPGKIVAISGAGVSGTAPTSYSFNGSTARLYNVALNDTDSDGLYNQIVVTAVGTTGTNGVNSTT